MGGGGGGWLSRDISVHIMFLDRGVSLLFEELMLDGTQCIHFPTLPSHSSLFMTLNNLKSLLLVGVLLFNVWVVNQIRHECRMIYLDGGGTYPL